MMLEYQNTSIYQRGKRVLDDFSLRVEDGAIFGLLGPDNTAKSRILAAAGGIQAPNSGLILLDDESIYREDSKAYLKIGYMPRKNGVYDLLRVDEYFDMFLNLYKINGRVGERRMEEVVELFEIRPYLSAYLTELPAEVLPILSLAKTILHDPEWLLLDEPFAELGADGRNAMIKILLYLQERGKSILINSQVFPETDGLYTHVAMIEDGRKVLEGDSEEIFESALKKSPVQMRVLSGMDQALAVLKQNELVDRVTLDEENVIFRFNGGDQEEAELLTDLVASGALIQNYVRHHINIEEIYRR